MSISSSFLPAKAVEYKVYKIVVFNARDLVTARFEVAALDRRAAERSGDAWAMRSGMTGWRTSVMRKIVDREPATILVAQ